MNEIIAIRCCVCVWFPYFFLVSFALFFLFCFSQLRVYLCLFLCLCVYSVYILFIFFLYSLSLFKHCWLGLAVHRPRLISNFSVRIVSGCFFSQFWQCCRERDLKIKQKQTLSFSVILFFSFYFSQKFTTFFVCLLLFSVTALKSLGVCMFIFSFFLVFCVCLDILSFVLLYTY